MLGGVGAGNGVPAYIAGALMPVLGPQSNHQLGDAARPRMDDGHRFLDSQHRFIRPQGANMADLLNRL
ncbi:hypothetical protein D3C80_2045590 [compost metagenome]